LKKIFSILIIFSIILPYVTKVGILIDFKINQDFIAKVLCINQDKPMLACNGKCYLAKQLKKTESNDKKNAPNSKREKVETLYLWPKSITDIYRIPKKNSTLNITFHKNKLHSFTYLIDIYRPPKLLIS